MTPPQRGRAKLADKIVYNSKFVHYFFELTEPHEVPFLAGQYVSIKVTESGLRRSYSIASSPENTHGFELVLDVTPAGAGTKFLEALQFGQEVEILYPLGMFYLMDEPSEKSLVYVANGSGIVPFRSMLLDQLQLKNDKREITLHWGLRHEADLIWEDEFQELSESYPNFHFHPVISQPTPEWPLCQGRVTDCLATHEFEAEAGYYLCGSTTMIADVVTFLIQRGVTRQHIHHENFY